MSVLGIIGLAIACHLFGTRNVIYFFASVIIGILRCLVGTSRGEEGAADTGGDGYDTAHLRSAAAKLEQARIRQPYGSVRGSRGQ